MLILKSCVDVPNPLPHGEPLGIDLGLEKFLAASNGKLIARPKFFVSLQGKLKSLQKQMSRKKKGSSNWKKACMKPLIISWIRSSCLLFCSLFVSMPTMAQVTADGTTSTTVTGDGNNFTIDDGDRAGGNLFHSFQDFSVPTNRLVRKFAYKSNGSELTSDINPEGQGDAGNIIINATESISLMSGSGIFARVLKEGATGTGGNVELATTNLSLTDRAQIVTDTSGNGNAGDVTIDATNIVIDGIDSQIRSAAFSSGMVNAGKIKITADSLSLNNEAEVNTSTLGRGDAGIVAIEATSVAVSGGSEIRSETTGQGNGGNVMINANNSVSVDGIGSDENGSAILARSFREAEGSGGNINITTDSLSVTNQAQVNVSSSARGSGGNIEVEANSLELDGGILQAATASGNPGKVNITADSLSLNNEAAVNTTTFGRGNAGTVEINATSVFVRGGSEIRSETAGQGDGGNVLINANNSVSVDGSSNGFGSAIFARSLGEAEGNGGNINITTDSLSVTDRARVNVSSSARGSGGNIEVEANSLELERGTLEATTAFGEGGNITLQIADRLTLREESTITAQAFENANGGNITIDAEFIIASLNQNNDIIASAERGRGGNINITAQGVFGLEERSSTPPNETNDIDASSEFGLDGTIVINTPDISSLQEAIEAPEIVQLQTLGTSACSGRGATGGSSFNITGKGGVPPELTAPLSSDTIFLEGKPIPIGTGQPERVKREQIKPLITAQGEIYPARGIIFLENGDIILTPYPTDNVQRTPHSPNNCGKS
ncbi:MAG: hypothetical protein QNJ41_01385 [Xenococcaceae cyanobacterium MO_188.B32]|nr:hypothetical protein [Xenococcaceae cyanobacterium MO_188.B32]